MGIGIRVPSTNEVGTPQYAFARLEGRPKAVLNIIGANAPLRAIARRDRSFFRNAHVRRDGRVPLRSINLSDIDGAAVFGYEPQD